MIHRTGTKDIIFQSLVELCQKTAVDKISVSDIMENCGYKRETFYYYYKSKEDLIVSALRDNVQKNHEIYSEERSWEYVMRKNLEFCEKHRHLMIWLIFYNYAVIG